MKTRISGKTTASDVSLKYPPEPAQPARIPAIVEPKTSPIEEETVTIQVGGLVGPGTLSLIPVKHVPEESESTTEGYNVVARMSVVVERAKAQKMERTTWSFPVQTEPSPQMDMACWLAETLMHTNLKIQTHPEAEPRSIRPELPGDVFYLFARENWK